MTGAIADLYDVASEIELSALVSAEVDNAAWGCVRDFVSIGVWPLRSALWSSVSDSLNADQEAQA